MTLTDERPGSTGPTAPVSRGGPDDDHDRPPIRLAILDEDPLLRAGIRSLMESRPQIEVVADADSVREMSAVVHRIRAEVLIAGAEHLDERFRCALPVQAHPGLRVVAIMQPGDQVMLRNAVMCTVSGYVDRATSHQDLGLAVTEAHGGRTYLSPSIAQTLVGWVATRIGQESVPMREIERALTERELQVLLAMADGVTNTTIARRLQIREATVRSHIYHIINKLDLRTRTEAVLAGHSYAGALRDGLAGTSA